MTVSVQPEVKKVSLTRAFVFAAVLVVVDAFLFNQGVIATIVGAWLLLVSLPRAVFKQDEQRRRRLARVAILLVATLLVFGLNWSNNLIARSRAEKLVAAINAFEQTNGRYPRDLNELVPDFIDHVPRAKYTFMFGEFEYVPAAEETILLYVQFPPFYRPFYSFAAGRWDVVD